LNATPEPRRTVGVGEYPSFSGFSQLYTVIHLNLAYRWFCRLGLDADVPDHSTFSNNRHGRFRESNLLRKLFETVVARCMKEGIVGDETSQSMRALSSPTPSAGRTRLRWAI
jgi:hypothetical protein